MTGRVRLLSAGLRAMELVTRTKGLDADQLAEAAWRSMGRPDVAFDDVLPALDQLLQAVEAEAELSALGRHATRWDVRRLLLNLLRFRIEEKQHPGIRDEPVAAPLFITGIPRSGTSSLHRLMTEDPAAQAPLCWQTIFPYPEMGRQAGAADRRVQRVDIQLRLFSALSPAIRSIHPISAGTPQECTEITAHVFRSLRFDTTYQIPSYRRWLAATGHLEAYRFHKTFLQHLQHQAGRKRWVLKCPDHVFALDAIAQVYPDARFIFVHRDPAKVIPSVARLTEVLRIPFAARLHPLDIGRQVMEDWARGCQIMVDTDRRAAIPPAQVIHVRYSDIASRPLDTLQRIYDHFGLPLTSAAVEKVSERVNRAPRGGYGTNSYHLEPFGITPEEIRERFQPYMDHFDIEPETSRAAPPIRPSRVAL